MGMRMGMGMDIKRRSGRWTHRGQTQAAGAKLTNVLVEGLGVVGRAERIDLGGRFGDGGRVLLELVDLGCVVVDAARNLPSPQPPELTAAVWMGVGWAARAREREHPGGQRSGS